MGDNSLDHSLKRKTETIGGQWSPSHATGFEGGMIPVTTCSYVNSFEPYLILYAKNASAMHKISLHFVG